MGKLVPSQLSLANAGPFLGGGRQEEGQNRVEEGHLCGQGGASRDGGGVWKQMLG